MREMKKIFNFSFSVILTFQLFSGVAIAKSGPEDIVYIRDFDKDKGNEPSNPPNGVCWESPEIRLTQSKERIEIFCKVNFLREISINGPKYANVFLKILVWWALPNVDGSLPPLSSPQWQLIYPREPYSPILKVKQSEGQWIRAATVLENSKDYDEMVKAHHLCLIVELSVIELTSQEERELDKRKTDSIPGENNLAMLNVFGIEYDPHSTYLERIVWWGLSKKDARIDAFELSVASSSPGWNCKLIDRRLKPIRPGVYGLTEPLVPGKWNQARLIAEPMEGAGDTEIVIVQRVNSRITGGITYKIRMETKTAVAHTWLWVIPAAFSSVLIIAGVVIYRRLRRKKKIV